MRCVLFLFFLCCTGFSFQPPACYRLDIAFTGLRNSQGKVAYLIFSGEDGYPSDTEKAAAKGMAEIRDGAAAVSVCLPAGKYALTVLHDENLNNKMDLTVIGLPKEGYGFSNNVMGMFGPPKFGRAGFVLQAPLSIKIEMRY